MNKVLLSCFFIALSVGLCAQSNSKFARVQIDMTDRTAEELAALGLEADHGIYRAGYLFISDFSYAEIDLLRQNGFLYEILIEDVSRYYVEQNKKAVAGEKSGPVCVEEGDELYPQPDNFELGSMGGYFTYQEMLDELDAMAAQFPELITLRAPVGTTLTHEEREVYYVKMSDNPTMDETEPEVLYTALHHAREPGGLSQMIYYMWYLLENYETDSFIQYMVNETALFFIPCVNPDGYLFNEANNPDGGGLWRKNRFDNGDGSFGVDLNRNYGWAWGIDDFGSSPNPSSNVYRGAAPFSEPETQLVRDFSEERAFEIALNYHTYGNFIIYPWAFTDELAPDYDLFREIAGLCTSENNYAIGTAVETVGYVVNGGSDDWMYGALDILAMTPEAGPGSFGFWPPSTEIVTICQDNMWQNLSIVAVLHGYGDVRDAAPASLEEIEGTVAFTLKNYGENTGTYSVSLEPVSANILSGGTNVGIQLDPYLETEQNVTYQLDPNIANGEELVYNLVVDNGLFEFRRQVSKVYGSGDNVFSDDFDNLTGWDIPNGADDWLITPEDFYSAPTSTTDSPFTNYAPNQFYVLELVNPVDLIDATGANLKFWAKWEIESFWDYAQVQASSDGINFVPLCGLYTKPGSVVQDPNQPIYDGTQNEWVEELMSLDDFIGGPVILRFVLVTDGGLQLDGFYLDDVVIETISGVATSVEQIPADQWKVTSYPIPADDLLTIAWEESDVGSPDLIRVFNSLGIEVLSQSMSGIQSNFQLNTGGFANGVYAIQAEENGRVLFREKAIIAR